MIATLKSEYRKLLSVRSTYLWVLVAVVLISIISIYVDGFKNSVNLVAGADKGKLFIAGNITQIANISSGFAGIIALLLMTHEYRYNTIVYTLSATNRRSKVLASKIVVILSFTLVYAVAITLLSIGLVYLGAALAHHNIPHQDINYLTFVAKAVFFCEGYALAALLFATLIRNQVGALAVLFIVPGTLEGVLSLLLKNNSVYMPFTALTQVVQPPVIASAKAAHPNNTGYLSAPRGALVFLAYLIFGWLVAWYLFLRRDAT
jgi:ABC-2 type transport system permease protein